MLDKEEAKEKKKEAVAQSWSSCASLVRLPLLLHSRLFASQTGL